MSTPEPRTIWLEGDLECKSELLDVYRNAKPWFWRSNDLNIAVALFKSKGVELYDLSNLSALRISIKENLLASTLALYEAEVLSADFDVPDIEDFYGFTEQHALFELTREDTNITMAAEERPLWISLVGITSDATAKELCFGTGRIILKDDGQNGSIPISDATSPEVYIQNGKLYAWDFGLLRYRHTFPRNGTWEFNDE